MLLPINPLLFLFTLFYQTSIAAIARRADETSTFVRSGTATSTITALTLFTPSPGADPIPITSQSQVVTSYIPLITICPLTITETAPAQPLPTLTANVTSRGTAASGNPFRSGASLRCRQGVDDSDAPYTNATIPTSILTACSVSYVSTTTSICHTTLSPLASPVIPITDCLQRVTFSTDHGYSVVPSTTGPYSNISRASTGNIQNLTSYYVAPWQHVYSGIPADVVDKIVCSISAGFRDCTTTAENWAPGIGWIKATNTISFTLGAPVTGPAEVIVHPSLPTFTVPDGEVTTMSLSTAFPEITSHATTTINRSPASADASTLSQTSGTSSAVPEDEEGEGEDEEEEGDEEEAEYESDADSTFMTTRTSTRTQVLTVQLATGT